MKKYLLSCLLCFFTLVPFYGQRVLFPTPSSYSQDKGNCNIGRLANVSGTGNEAIQLAESLKAELQHLPLSATEEGTIQFVLDEKNGLSEEAYQLTVTAEKVLLEASTVPVCFMPKKPFYRCSVSEKEACNVAGFRITRVMPGVDLC